MLPVELELAALNWWAGWLRGLAAASRGGVLLFDRYHGDLLVDPRRYRYGAPLGWARLASRLMPQPDLVLFLDAGPDVLLARKQEVSREGLERSRQRYRELDYPAIVRLCEAFLQVDFTGRLGEINAPTCILVGGADKLKGPEYARILKRGIPQAELHILPGAGHASCWEKPEEFNTVVLGFLAKQTHLG